MKLESYIMGSDEVKRKIDCFCYLEQGQLSSVGGIPLKSCQKSGYIPVEWMKTWNFFFFKKGLGTNAETNHPPPMAAGMWFQRLEVQTHSIK